MRIAFLAFDDVQALDVSGPWEVFSGAARFPGVDYELELLAPSARALRTSSGLRLVPDRSIGSAGEPIDTLVVAGGVGVAAAEHDKRVVGWLKEAAPQARRVASVCTGAFLLARAGLLDGRRATTHWSACSQLARRYPATTVEGEPIFVRDGHVYTSAGVTAGIDLALALVEEDHGPKIAREIARWLVLFLKRPGGQSQFSAELGAAAAERDSLRELQEWIAHNLREDLSVPALAARAFMSQRNFARAFRREVGTTPAAYVEGLRVERARAALEGGQAPVDEVARQCGFGTVETMRRAFRRRLGVSPSDYRNRFRPALSGAAAEA